MMVSKKKSTLSGLLALVAAGGLAVSQTAHADYVLVEDFEAPAFTINAGINGINGWTADAGAQAAIDPAGGVNQVGRLTGTNTGASKAATISNSDTGTFFFRWRRADTAGNFNFGNSDAATATGFGDFETQVVIEGFSSGTDTTLDLEVNDYGQKDTDQDWQVDVWFNTWIVVDAAEDEYQVYIQGGSYGSVTQITIGAETDFSFRNSNPANPPIDNDILSLFFKNNFAAAGPVYIDDLYIDATASNLTNPLVNNIPEPSTLAMGLISLVALMRRKKSA